MVDETAAEGATAANPDAVDEPLAKSTAADPDAAAAEPLSKRTVAFHVAYVGTSFKGSSVNRTLGEDSTVEQVLELAILKAGLMKEANFGSFSKVKWTRASRTDKGVHSLGTVMGMRMLVHDDRYTATGDPEGLTHADMINKHLPPAVRVLTVQKVHKKFNARFLASSRVYEYYLPASLLELRMDGSDFDAERIDKLRQALRTFLGSRPFHNYTKMRAHDGSRTQTKDYNKLREEAASQARQRGEDPRVHADEVKAMLKQQLAEESQRKKQKLDDAIKDDENSRQKLDDKDGQACKEQGTADGPACKEQETADGPACKEQETADGPACKEQEAADAPACKEQGAADPGGGTKQRLKREADGDDGEEDDDDEEGELDDLDEARPQDAAPAQRELQLSWTKEDGPHDRVTQTYYRKIFSFEADAPVPLVDGGTPCLRLSVHGQSFMLHHIRHMIGTAVAVALGVLPMDLLEASLQPPARVTLPRAPPHTLLLSDCQFYPFPAATGGRGGGVDSGLASITGDRLGVRQGGQERKEEFRRSVLQPALQTLVDLPDWQLWLENLKTNSKFALDRLEPFLQEYRDWMSQADARRQRRAESKPGSSTGAECSGASADAVEAGADEERGKGRGQGGGRGRGGGRGQGKEQWWKKRRQGK